MAFIFDALTSGTFLTLERLLLPGLANTTHSLFSWSNQPMQSLTALTIFFVLSHPETLFPCPNHPWTKYEATEESLYAPGSSEIIQPSQSRLLMLPCPFLPMETKIKALVHIFLCCLCLLTDPGSSLCITPWCGLLLQYMTITNYLINGNCLLICWPCYT